MTTKVETAVARRDEELAGLTRMIETYSNDYARVLPSHVEPATFVRLAQGVLRRNPDLAEAAKVNPNSFLVALLECAQLGHRPGSDCYALTPRRVKDKGSDRRVLTVVGIEMYRGVIERMYRAGAVVSVKCEVVRQYDRFEWSPTRMRVPVHEFDPLASLEDRGKIRGVYAYADMQGGGTSRVVVMSKDVIDRHRKLAATDNFWRDWEEAMTMKTAVHELEKWVPTSAEYIRERARAIAEAHQTRRELAEPAPATPQRPEPPLPAPLTVEGHVVDQVEPITEPGEVSQR